MVFVVDFCVTFFTLTPCWLLTFGQSLYIYIHIFILKKVDNRNLNSESYIDMHTVNYLGLVQIQIQKIYSSGHGIKNYDG